jgi:hypothetical protein
MRLAAALRGQQHLNLARRCQSELGAAAKQATAASLYAFRGGGLGRIAAALRDCSASKRRQFPYTHPPIQAAQCCLTPRSS